MTITSYSGYSGSSSYTAPSSTYTAPSYSSTYTPTLSSSSSYYTAPGYSSYVSASSSRSSSGYNYYDAYAYYGSQVKSDDKLVLILAIVIPVGVVLLIVIACVAAGFYRRSKG